MKKAGCALLGCGGLVMLLVAAALGVLWWAAPAETGTEAAKVPSAQAEAVPAPPGQPGGERLRLTFRFNDEDDEPREFRCEIRRADLDGERGRYGIAKAQIREELNGALGEHLRREAAARGMDRYFEIEAYDEGSIRWTYQDPEGADAETGEKIAEFDTWLKQQGLASFQSIADQHYREHGIRLEGDTLKVDYAAQVQEATEPLADCFQALQKLDRGGARSPIGLFLTFFQDLRYQLPPEVDERGRQTLGFWVPTDVLARGAGDCDSKAAAFCALWRQLPARVLLVLVPEHALVAVEGKPGPDQKSIRLGNRYYILCEVAGPGRLPPGETDSAGNFEYILIEPAG